jgi:hypothetical protein
VAADSRWQWQEDATLAYPAAERDAVRSAVPARAAPTSRGRLRRVPHPLQAAAHRVVARDPEVVGRRVPEPRLGIGRIVVSEMEPPNVFVSLV